MMKNKKGPEPKPGTFLFFYKNQSALTSTSVSYTHLPGGEECQASGGVKVEIFFDKFGR